LFYCRAYPPADSRQPKPFLLPGFILPLIGCGSLFYFFCVGFFRFVFRRWFDWQCISVDFGARVILFVVFGWP